MAEFNSCAKLYTNKTYNDALNEYNKIIKSGNDPFEKMLEMQRSLQIALHKKNSKYQNIEQLKTLGEKFEFLREQKQALDDEYREVIDALPGMNTPEKDRSALWKMWKAKYNEIRNKTFDDLSESELLELKFELCDMFHFFMNMFFALDMTAKDMFILYYIKNAENFDRCKRGY